jgi:hypothetical protein
VSTKPIICIVDTNVVIAANGEDLLDEEQYCCIVPCIEFLEHVTKGRCRLVLDEGYEIIREYQHKFDMNKQKGFGVAFIKWAWDNCRNTSKIVLVPITPSKDSYTEFPQHAGLADFDPSDRKFVAVANAYPNRKKPVIAQAMDSKWHKWEKALLEVGISVHFVHKEYSFKKYSQNE